LATNGRQLTFDKVAKLKIFPIKVFFNPSSIATILSLRDIAGLPGVCLTMDTSKKRAILLHMSDGSVAKFKEGSAGLYFYDMDNNSNSSNVFGYMAAQTVCQNKQFFTRNDLAHADKVHKYQAYLGWPFNSTFIDIVKNNQVINCDIKVNDILRGIQIYRNHLPLAKRKMKRRRTTKKMRRKRRSNSFLLSEVFFLLRCEKRCTLF